MTIAIASERLLAFKERLRACLNYCHDRRIRLQNEGDHSGVYRSAELEPAATSVFPDSCHTKPSHDLSVRFDEFVSTRMSKTSQPPIPESVVQEEISRPKSLLLTDFAKSLFDGAVTPETDGFVNDDCMPPWDCWIDLLEVETSYGGWCLVSWVPASLSDQIDFSIEVDAAECMSWLRLVGDNLEILDWGRRWHNCE